jgi:uncharacterized membrane protein required for colicin V production
MEYNVTVFDMAVVLLVIVYAILGYKQGVIYKLLSFAELIVAFLLAYFLHPMLMDIFERFAEVTADFQYNMFIVLFSLIIGILSMLLGSIIKTLGNMESPPKFVKITGGILGLFSGVIISGLLVCLAVIFIPDAKIAGRMQNGLITSKASKTLSVTYNVIDKLIKKNGITPKNIIEYNLKADE